MKPLHLTIQAFGPFSGTESIDFALLGQHPLFLINGPTGAGKSSILDAMCFALYGQTTGNEREAAQMRCDFSSADVLTEVSFTFGLAEQQYRIKRIPQQERPKSRGDGTTSQSPEAQLYRLNADGGETLLVAKSVNDANAEIRQLLGLNVEQFRQVMVLPQGRFRDLLMADSKERELIFSQLFQTHIYKKIEDALKEKAAGISKEKQQQDHKVIGLLESQDLVDEAALLYELDEMKPELQRALAEKIALSTQKKSLEVEFNQAQSLQKEFDRLRETKAAMSRLSEQQDAIDSLKKKLALATQAQRIRYQYDAANQAQNDCLSKIEQIKEIEKQKTLIEAEHKIALRDEAEAEVQAETLPSLKRQLLQFEAYQTLLGKRQYWHEQQCVAIERLTQIEHEVESAKKANEKNQLHLTKLEEQQKTLSQSVTTEGEQKLIFEQLTHKLQQRIQLQGLRDGFISLRERVFDANQRCEAAQKKYLDAEVSRKTIELSWHKNQAAMLAQDLNVGDACPVCGSVEHPRLATYLDGAPVVSDAQLDEVRQQESKLREDWQAEKINVQNVTRDLTEQERLGQEFAKQLGALAEEALPSIKKRQQDQEKALIVITEQKKQLQLLSENIRQCIATLELDKSNISNLSKQLHDQETLNIEALSNVKTWSEQLPIEFRDEKFLQKQFNEIKGAIETIEVTQQRAQQRAQSTRTQLEKESAKLDANLKSLDSEKERADRLHKEWVDALMQNGFKNDDEFLKVQMDAGHLQQWQDTIAAHNNALQRQAGVLQQLEDSLGEQELPDLEHLQAQLDDCSARLNIADTEWRRWDQRHNQLQALKAKLDAVHNDNAELEARYKIYGTLSEVANGQTGNKISLQRFVLSVLLDDVLIQASQRLHIMSKGRYQLLRKEDRSKGNKASGLELEVEDSYSGKTRPVATLSGGESFMAALALALGLSDVVQSYAGGVRLDTLFIDEGFGSLDPESLALALTTLLDLQASGRTIGIISHVTELKEQMALRVDVLSSRVGSRIQVVAA